MSFLAEFSDSELSIFSRALHEARFAELENDPIVWISPFVIGLHVAALDEQKRRMGERGQFAEIARMAEWLRWEGRPEAATVVRRIRENPSLRIAIEEGDGAVLREILLPFSLSDEDISRVVAQLSE